MPGERMKWTELYLDSSWFPEVSLGDLYDTQTLAQMDAHDSLQVFRLVHELDGRGNSTAMYRISHEGRPVLIVQQAGEGHREHFQRFVTHPRAYVGALTYLSQFIVVPDSDVADGDELHHEDVLLYFGGRSRAAQLARDEEPRHEGVLLLSLERLTKRMELGEDFLVSLKAGALPLTEYIRRGTVVLKRVKQFTADELDTLNPRIRETSESTGYDRQYLYQVSSAPDGKPVTRV